jgi:hypothetical protein
MSTKKISKTMIVIIVVAVLAISSIAAYVALSGTDGSGDNTENGKTTENGNTEPESSEPENSETTGADVEGASSMHFKVTIDPAEAESINYEYTVKNAGTTSLMMRIEMESAGEEVIYIINGVQETVWLYSGGEWVEFSELYQSYWETWSTAWQGYQTNLVDWTGEGDWSYTASDGSSVRIYDISVNPSLADSLFEP